MCSKSINDQMDDLYKIVSNLDPDAQPSPENYIEVIEAPLLLTKPLTTKSNNPPLRKTRLLPLNKPPNFFQRTFSFVGKTRRGYYFSNTLCLLFLSTIVIGFVHERELNEDWGMIILALAAWSLVATTVKRWRDTGHSMWWILTLIIPYISVVTMFFLVFAPSRDKP